MSDAILFTEEDYSQSTVEESIYGAVAKCLLRKQGRPTSALAHIDTLTILSLCIGNAREDRARFFDGGLSLWTVAGYLDIRPDIKAEHGTISLFNSEGQRIMLVRCYA